MAIYLKHENGISYKSFYENLITWLDNQPSSSAGGGAFAHLKELTEAVSEGSGTFSVPYGENEIITWSFEEYIFFRLARELDKFYKELSDFALRFDIPREISEQLLNYQKAIIKQPAKDEIEIKCSFDFYTYFNRIYSDSYSPLEKKNIILRSEGSSQSSWDEYARVCIWYGRRDDAQLYTGKKNKVTLIKGDEK